MADYLINRKLGVTRTRKLLNSAGFAVASVALMLLPYAKSLGEHNLRRAPLSPLCVKYPGLLLHHIG